MPEKPAPEALLQRIALLEKTNAELEQARRDGKKTSALLNAIQKVHSLYIIDTDPAEICKLLLQSLVEISESQYGFLDEVVYAADGTLSKKNLAISDISWDEHSRALYRQLIDRDLIFSYLDNLSGLPALTGETIISNDAPHDPRSKGLPPGHPPIRTFMGMPLYFGGRLVCVAGLANRKEGYNTEIVEFLDPLLSTCACITYAIQKNSIEKENEKRLEDNKQRFQTVADFTYDWEYWRGPDDRYLYVSPSCRRISGYDPEDFINKPDLMERIIHPQDLPLVVRHHQQAGRAGSPQLIEFRITTKTGQERWIGQTCQPVYDGDKRYLGIRGSNRDITEQKRLQRESMKAHEMEAISTLAGGVAHQFNNALAVISGSLELMEEDYGGEKDLCGYTSEMKTAGERMRQLTAQLLAYARGGRYQSEAVFFSDFIAETIPLIRPSLGPLLEIKTTFTEKELRVDIDRPQMQLMLSAVLTNASEALNGKGQVNIACRRITAAGGDSGLPPELEPGAYACLTVSDDGPGMDENTLNRIFEPFFTTKFEGRGLGMAAAFGIAKNHRGAIAVASQTGKGTTVSIYLPLLAPAARKIPQALQGRPEPQSKGTALVIDDDQSVMKVCRSMLQRLGYRVLEAGSGRQALRLLSTYEGSIDFALLDVLMPDISGDALYPLLKDIRKDLKVIVNSGYALEGPARTILNAGAETFIQKPFSKEDLQRKIAEIEGSDRSRPLESST